MIRRGRNEFLDGGEFATIPLAGLADALRIGDGETIEDVRRRLDPERITHVLGVTEDGRIDGAIVPTGKAETVVSDAVEWPGYAPRWDEK